MNRLEHILTTIIEEACEVGQAASKALRFGIDAYEPKSETGDNETRIYDEVADLLGMVDLLLDEMGHGNDFGDFKDARLAKRKKFEKYLLMCKEIGTLKED